MAGRDIEIPFGPDKTGGLGLQALAPEVADQTVQQAYGDAGTAPLAGVPAVVQPHDSAPAAIPALENAPVVPVIDAPEPESTDGSDYLAGGMTDEEAVVNGMDDMQMSILALKESIGQGRELKALEKDRGELAEALKADHEELADREDILANYDSIVAEQDAILQNRTQQRDVLKGELSQVTASIEKMRVQLDQVRERWSAQLQPVETDLGRVKAEADRAKNDERSRKSELNAAESELRRTSDSESNAMAVSRRTQAEAAYTEARRRTEDARAQLAQVQRAYDDAKQQQDQEMSPLEMRLDELTKRSDSLKEDISELSDEIAEARNRRQYCETVYRYPDETVKMRGEVEAAEDMARQMDVEIHQLKERLEQSKQMASKAKIALGILIVVVIVIIIAFVFAAVR